MKIMSVEVEKKNVRSNPLFKAELIAGGGKKQVPCIRVEENGSVRWIYESNDIIKYMKLQCS
jgi:glutathione S-transferase